METLDWAHVDGLFAQALDLDREARAAFLDRACDGDHALRARLDGLLAAEAASDGFLDRRPGGLVTLGAALAARFDDGPDDPAGRRVGPYRIVREIGRGGMGVVYLAERADGAFDQRVALKLLKRGLDTDVVVRRFLRERAVLARLEHPAIARLFDGGSTADGLPYFAMEVVEGEPIDAYCDNRRLPVEARLHLFADVCRAVEYAHHRLVVHRDLKPSNVLVAEGADGRPQVKLLDFGIARLLAADADEESLTRTGVPVLTPAYAAPEQAAGGAITTETDVYALGGVLYALLAGAPPQGPQGAAATGAPPPRPSVAAGHPAVAAEVAACRSTTPRRLARALEGDLDTICLTALQADPAARYATPGRLRDDVERHLDDLPIVASRPSAGARARAFVRRYRTRVALAATALLVLAGYAATVTLQARQLEAERDRTALEASKATAAAAFLTDLFETSDPYAVAQVRGDTVTARTLLDRGADRARRDLTGEPVVQAEMLDQIGGVYARLGLYAEADSLLARALVLRRRHLGPRTPDVAASAVHLAEVRWHLGRYEEAEHLFQAALAIDSTPSEAVAERVNSLGTVVQAQGRNVEAEALHRRALAMRRALPDTPPEALAASLNDLAWALQAQGRDDEAEQHFREALQRYKETYGPVHPYVAVATGNVGRALLAQGRAAEAERYVRESLRIDREVFPPGHPLTVRHRNTLGACLAALGRYPEAERLLLDSHAALLAARGPDHFHVVESRQRLASLYDAWGRPADAARYR